MGTPWPFSISSESPTGAERGRESALDTTLSSPAGSPSSPAVSSYPAHVAVASAAARAAPPIPR